MPTLLVSKFLNLKISEHSVISLQSILRSSSLFSSSCRKETSATHWVRIIAIDTFRARGGFRKNLSQSPVQAPTGSDILTYYQVPETIYDSMPSSRSFSIMLKELSNLTFYSYSGLAGPRYPRSISIWPAWWQGTTSRATFPSYRKYWYVFNYLTPCAKCLSYSFSIRLLLYHQLWPPTRRCRPPILY